MPQISQIEPESVSKALREKVKLTVRQHSSKLDHLGSKSLQSREAYLAKDRPQRDHKDEQPGLEVTGGKLCTYDFG